MKLSRQFFRCFTLTAVILAAVGCGGKQRGAVVTGKVTVAGKNPLPGGNITFALVSDPTLIAGGVIKSDGTFEVVDVPVGECKVVIDNTNLDVSKNAMGMGMGPGGTGMMPGAPAMKGAPGMGSAGGGAMSGPPANTKEKMSKPPKGADIPTGMDVDHDAGTKKYVKIDPSFTKLDSTTLKHTVIKGENKNINFDVK